AIKRIYPEIDRGAPSVIRVVKSEDFSDDKNKILVSGHSDLACVLSSCCKPVFGDSIVGYVARGKKIRIHRADCENLSGLDDRRFVEVSWKGQESHSLYQAEIVIEAVERHGLISDITSVISGLGCNIVNMTFNRGEEGLVLAKIAIEIRGYDQLEKILDRIEGVSGVKGVRTEERR
ncbi:MAG: ACT domain-containing protein, partial [Candidatus Gracilibacteria bacterium]